MKTVHIIFHTHIDSVWLWKWHDGLDAAISTFRSVCEKLEKYKDIYFTFGDAWFFFQIEKVDEELFKKIKSSFGRLISTR